MNLKTLARQHADFAAMQERKAAQKAARDAKQAEKAKRWAVTQEKWRKNRERKARASDLAYQHRLEADPAYLDTPYTDTPNGGPWMGESEDACVPDGGPSHKDAQ